MPERPPIETSLPAEIDVAAFDAWHDDLPAWRAVIEAIAAEEGGGTIEQMPDSTAMVALLGDDRVLKLYPPFLRDHCDFERAALVHFAGRLGLPTPQLLGVGEHDGWPYLLISRLPGLPLVQVWPGRSERQRQQVLGDIGRLAAQAHAMPVAPLAALAPAWPSFVQQQRARCAGRQQRTGLPPHLLAQLPAFIEGPLPTGDDVVLTGEYTPMNLMWSGDALSGMFDFGDGLVGPREYDWLGPLCFLAAGHAARVQAFMEGYGALLDADLRRQLLRLLLLHRYSHLPAQIACPGWQQAPDLDTLAALIWPLA
jgi:hygromycin-B 7''-O-kinase